MRKEKRPEADHMSTHNELCKMTIGLIYHFFGFGMHDIFSLISKNDQSGRQLFGLNQTMFGVNKLSF